ncbi:hypothetical protein [Spirosoma endophyticum]|uniref:Uncharacterized protein n=1 Tax=Spirosoma endophyticum TaxID=662367 RepID=A0A1I1HIM5_9BACT|nr:hypothetical protein [Spirosoma endophyticum]SFC23701.1 hypothetical protein SAMN05216167_101712 [Spirosoma endophyticum]
MLIDLIPQDDWLINGWKIYFSLHDKLQLLINRNAPGKNWYEDEAVNQYWLRRLGLWMISIHQYYDAFGVLPHVGDRLSDQPGTGLLVFEREVNGLSTAITYILSD